MRIIAGKLGGRQFEPPKGHRTHPMSDKMRGALFSVLGDIDGLTVLDAFAGSGALSFEAISRGASHATAVDIDKNATDAIAQGVKSFDVSEQVKTIRANVSSWASNNKKIKFDLIFCDPPYDKLQLVTLQKLVLHLKPSGVYILSWPGRLLAPDLQGLKQVKSNNFGDSQLIFYQAV